MSYADYLAIISIRSHTQNEASWYLNFPLFFPDEIIETTQDFEEHLIQGNCYSMFIQWLLITYLYAKKFLT